MHINPLNPGGLNFNVDYNCREFNFCGTFIENFKYFCKIQTFFLPPEMHINPLNPGGFKFQR